MMRTTVEGVLRLALVVSAAVAIVGCVAAPPRVEMPERPAEEEQLVDVPTTTPAPATSVAPVLTVLSVAAQPARVRPGQETAMVVTYTLEGGSGASLQVEEHRRLLKQETLIREWRDAMARDPGTHTSSKPLRVPGQAAPGVYTLKVTLTAASARAEGSGIFEVH